MIKAKFSNSYNAKMNRIKKLPDLVNDAMSGALKKDAIGLIEEYKKGIRTDSLGLRPLAPFTIKDKKRLNTPKPSVPLYGLGDQEKNSLINCLRIRTLKNGYKVFPSKGIHHNKLNESSNPKTITLDKLFKIHENGAIIPISSKMRYFLKVKKRFILPDGKKNIILHPRPAFSRAYKNWMIKRKNNQKETSRLVKQAINDYINKADNTIFLKLMNFKKRLKDLEE